MYEMAIVTRKPRFFMLVIGFCMLLFSGLPSAGEVEGPETPGLDQEEVQAITRFFLTPSQVKSTLIDNGDLVTDGKVAITKALLGSHEVNGRRWTG